MVMFKNVFVSVFPSNEINPLIDLQNIMSSKRSIYSFLISNTDQSEKAQTLWSSILDLAPKYISFFC